MLPSSRLSNRVAGQLIRAASISPAAARFKSSASAATEPVVDPAVFLQLRQRIIERHNPSAEPHSQLGSKAISDIARGLNRQDVSLVQKSWAELRRLGLIHNLTRDVVEQIGQLASKALALPGGSKQTSFAEEVALAAAAAHSTDALNACFLAHLREGDPHAILALHERFQLLQEDRDSPKLAELAESEEEMTESLPGRVSAFLAVVAARAMQDDFYAALKDYLAIPIKLRPSVTEAFLHTISFNPALQNKVSVFVQRLDLAKTVVRAQSLSEHIQTVSRSRPAFLSGLETLYDRIAEAMYGPDAYIAPDRHSVTSTKPVFMSELVWASFIVAFLRRNRSDLAVKLWKDMSRSGVKAGVMTWNMVLEMYSERRATKEIVEAWGTMKAQGVEPNATTYRVVISALFSERRVADAMRWFRSFETEIVPSSLSEQILPVYNAVLHGLTANRQHSDTVISLFQKMKDVGPKPDLVCYNTMLGFYGRSGDFKALGDTINQMEGAGIPGDVYTFSTILSALLKAGRSDAPDVVQDIMRKQAIRPTTAFYTTIIDAQMREQTIPHLQAAMRLLDEMDRNPSTAPNDVTYTSILAGLYRGPWLSASQLETYRTNIVSRMKRRKIKIRVHGYNILIKACLTSREPSGLENALRLYRELKEQYTPTNDTWFILLAALIGRGEWQIAEEVATEVLSSGVRPSNSVVRLIEDIRKNTS